MVNLKSNKPMQVKNKDHLRDNRLTTCTDCRWGIFTGHEYLWTKRGMVHPECEDKRLLSEAANIEGTLHVKEWAMEA